MDRQTITIREAPGQDAREVLASVLDSTGFWQLLASTASALKSDPGLLHIVIKPDLDIYDLSLLAGTDPALVEHLSKLLHNHGYTHVDVLDSRNSNDAWLLNRDPLMVADLAGYDFSSPYYNLPDDTQASPAQLWARAHFRINFAKNRTSEAFSYALCAHNLKGVSSETSNDVAECCLQVLREAPPHFNLIDACISCHGAAGERVPRMLQTSTLLASSDTLLVDLFGALKMGLDPYASPVNAKCLNTLGAPESYDLEGNATPYALWQNVHPLVSASARQRNDAEGMGPIAEAWFQRVDRQHFPFREFYAERINSFIVPLLERLGEDARAQWLIVCINYLIAYLGNAILAQYTLFSKGELIREERSMETNLAQFADTDYSNLPVFVASFEKFLAGVHPGDHEMRMQRIDDAVLFSAAFEFPIEFGSFVRKVKIERAIQYMNDYIGGSVVTVARDGRKRVVMQAERNLYLQQPNWMVLFCGKVIDVEKLEYIQYRRNERSLYWRTIASPNDSADSDDGRVSFIRAPNGCTRVEIFTRQKFALPLFFDVVRIDLLPSIRDPIVERAYRHFFERTIANLQAEYDGKEYRVGRDALSLDSLTGNGMKDLARYGATAVASVAELLRHKNDFSGVTEWFGARTWTTHYAATPVQGPDNFQHFGPSPNGTRYDRPGNDVSDYFRQLEDALSDAPGFWTGLAAAVQKDFEHYAQQQSDAPAP